MEELELIEIAKTAGPWAMMAFMLLFLFRDLLKAYLSKRNGKNCPPHEVLPECSVKFDAGAETMGELKQDVKEVKGEVKEMREEWRADSQRIAVTAAAVDWIKSYIEKNGGPK